VVVKEMDKNHIVTTMFSMAMDKRVICMGRDLGQESFPRVF
jgi:hypothetical protein